MADVAPSQLPATEQQKFTSRQSGVALITVLLITAILVGLTTQILSSHHLVTAQHQNSFEQEQALQYAIGAEELARQALYDDFINSGPGVDHLEELWAQPALPFDLDGVGVLQAYVVDLHRCFNLNNLGGSAGTLNHERLKRLLTSLELSPDLADLVKDWVDADQNTMGFGAEDSTYQLKQPPYLAANQPMTDISELSSLAEAEPAQIGLLAKRTCLLPDTATKINVNTASALTLSALDPTVTVNDALAITQLPRNFLTVDEFLSSNPAFNAVRDDLSVTSEYFLLIAQAQLNRSRVSLQSLMRRDPGNGAVTLLQRDFGKRFRHDYLVPESEDST